MLKKNTEVVFFAYVDYWGLRLQRACTLKQFDNIKRTMRALWLVRNPYFISNQALNRQGRELNNSVIYYANYFRTRHKRQGIQRSETFCFDRFLLFYFQLSVSYFFSLQARPSCLVAEVLFNFTVGFKSWWPSVKVKRTKRTHHLTVQPNRTDLDSTTTWTWANSTTSKGNLHWMWYNGFKDAIYYLILYNAHNVIAEWNWQRGPVTM